MSILHKKNKRSHAGYSMQIAASVIVVSIMEIQWRYYRSAPYILLLRFISTRTCIGCQIHFEMLQQHHQRIVLEDISPPP